MLTWMHRLGRRLGAIALLALIIRAVVPAGYMLAHADTGAGRYLTLRLCDSHSNAVQIIDLDTGKRIDVSKLPGKAEQKHAPCVFAAAIAMVQPEASPQPVAFRMSRDIDFALVRDLRPGRGIPAPPPPSTGPPTSI